MEGINFIIPEKKVREMASGAKTFYIFVGVSGAGKTTAGRALGEPNEADAYRGLYDKGVINPRKLGRAHEWCQSNVRRLMSRSVPTVVQSNTNLNVDHIIPYLDMAIEFGYQVRFVLPKNDLLFYETKRPMSRREQVKLISSVRGSLKSGDKIVPGWVIRRMVDGFDKVRPVIEGVGEETDPKKVKSYLRSL